MNIRSTLVGSDGDTSNSSMRPSISTGSNHNNPSGASEAPPALPSIQEEEEGHFSGNLDLRRHALVYGDMIDHGECNILLTSDLASLRSGKKTLANHCNRCIYMTLFQFDVLQHEDRVMLWCLIL